MTTSLLADPDGSTPTVGRLPAGPVSPSGPVSPASPVAVEPIDDDVFRPDELATTYARCSDGEGTLSYLFFSDDDHEIARAKAICARCGLKDACLGGAIERQEPYGVWGGQLVLDGVPVEFKRKRGRPRKHPHPVLVVDEVPLPPHLVA